MDKEKFKKDKNLLKPYYYYPRSLKDLLGKNTARIFWLKSTEAKVNEKKKHFISHFGEIISQCLDVIVLGEMEFLIVSSSGFQVPE